MLHGLNLYEEFVRQASPMRTYRLCNGTGQLIKEFSLDRIAAEFGSIGLLERQQLIRLLRSRISPESIRWGVTVETMAQSREEVHAAVLADELSGSDARSVSLTLRLFVTRRRARVLAAQEDSRKLAKLMFVQSPALAALRNQLMRCYSIEAFARNIARSLAEPA